ncbi:MAG: sigma-70 family RNA polymerase sigma factor [Desulfobulbaceae bacterium]|nr:sigma-70 family RNA polymerase sigma factor [Desulfobulbaceae bacterium]
MSTATTLVSAKTADSPTTKVNHTGINQYLREISRYRLLTVEETERFAHMVRDKEDSWAGRQLITGNLRLVVRVVMDFQKYWMDNFLDLIQEGNVGLTRAVLKFDPSLGVKFSSYASYWIRAYVLKFIMDNCRLVKIGTSQSQRKLFYQLNKAKKSLESQGIEPTTHVLSQRLQIKESEIENMGQRLDNFEVSLDFPMGSDGIAQQKMFLAAPGPGVEEEVADQEFIDWFHAKLAAFTKSIDPREKVILYERLMSDDPRTLTHIAQQFGVSRERIRQLEGELLKKLRGLLSRESELHY